MRVEGLAHPVRCGNRDSYFSAVSTSRLQGLVIGLQSELEDLRAQFSTTVEQARVDGVSGLWGVCSLVHPPLDSVGQGEMAAAEVGGFYEDGERVSISCVTPVVCNLAFALILQSWPGTPQLSKQRRLGACERRRARTPPPRRWLLCAKSWSSCGRELPPLRRPRRSPLLREPLPTPSLLARPAALQCLLTLRLVCLPRLLAAAVSAPAAQALVDAGAVLRARRSSTSVCTMRMNLL